MKAALRFFIILAVFLIPITFIEMGSLSERFPIIIGVTLAVTIGYWVSYAIIEKKRKQQSQNKNA